MEHLLCGRCWAALILKMALRRDFYLLFTEEEAEAKPMVTPEATASNWP